MPTFYCLHQETGDVTGLMHAHTQAHTHTRTHTCTHMGVALTGNVSMIAALVGEANSPGCDNYVQETRRPPGSPTELARKLVSPLRKRNMTLPPHPGINAIVLWAGPGSYVTRPGESKHLYVFLLCLHSWRRVCVRACVRVCACVRSRRRTRKVSCAGNKFSLVIITVMILFVEYVSVEYAFVGFSLNA